MTAIVERSTHDLRMGGPRTEVVADLILVRLLPAGSHPGPVRLSRDLAPFFRRPPDLGSIQRAIEALRESEAIEPTGLELTDRGRERGLAFLGLTEWPPRWTWRTLKRKVLPARALGLPTGSPEVDRILQNADRLSAALLKRKLGLPVGTGSTVHAVLEALVCRELGFPDLCTLDQLSAAVLSRRIGSDRRLDASSLEKQVPRVILGTHGRLADLRELLLAGYAEAAAAAHDAAPVDLDLSAFAHRVRAVARECPTGRFGPDKVFVSHVWTRVQAESAFRRMDLPGFKRRLVEANAADLLTLSRADLVQLMDPDDVRGSEIFALNAVFHFVSADPMVPPASPLRATRAT